VKKAVQFEFAVTNAARALRRRSSSRESFRVTLKTCAPSKGMHTSGDAIVCSFGNVARRRDDDRGDQSDPSGTGNAYCDCYVSATTLDPNPLNQDALASVLVQ